MFKKILKGMFPIFVLLLMSAWIKPIYLIPKGDELGQKNTQNSLIIFKDDFASGGYTYTYPDTSTLTPIDSSEKFGELILQFDLDSSTYSGGAVAFPSLDLTSIRKTGSLEFYVRGKRGKEKFLICLIDSEKDGKKVETRVKSGSFIKVSKTWQKVVVPLSKFKDMGFWWDGKTEQKLKFDWTDVIEFKISIAPGPLPFHIEVGDIAFHTSPSIKIKELPPVTPIKTDSQNDGIALGIFGEGFQGYFPALHQFESKIGKKFAMVMWYEDWQAPFPEQTCENLYKEGYVPHIVWEAWFWGQSDKINLDKILNGEWDSYIHSWAKSIAKWGKPIVIRWGHEFNGNWYPWSLAKNGKDPKKYIKTFRYIHDIYEQEGAKNVLWAWSPNNGNIPNEPWNEYLKAYPGDKYVDWIAIDGYNNFGTEGGSGKWLSFNDVFWDIYANLITHIKKPIMIGEFATGSSGGNKAKWLLNMNKELQKNYQGIKSIVWFNIDKETDWRLDENYESLKTARGIFQQPYYLTDKNSLQKLSKTFYSHYDAYVAQVKKIQEKFSQKPTLLISQKKSSFIIDGKLDDWKNIPITATIDKSKEFEELGVLWNGPNDSKADIKFAWDKETFYIAVNIADDVPMLNLNDNGNIWNGDAFEFTLSTDPKSDLKRKKFAKTDFHIGITPGSKEKKISPFAWCWELNKKLNAKIAISKTKMGYIIEASIPWSNFNNFSPTLDTKYGFNMALDDADEGTREAQSVWFGTGDFYKDPSLWGFLKFIK